MQLLTSILSVHLACDNLTNRHSSDSPEAKICRKKGGRTWCEEVAADTQQRNRFGKTGKLHKIILQTYSVECQLN